MLVNRRTFVIKRGHIEDAAAMLAEGMRRMGVQGRVYLPEVGPFDVIAVEGEFESLAAYEQFWSAWAAQPDTGAFMERWYAITESGGANEIWRLAE
ncbi:MAG TPA: hypothetical protein VNL77_02825 [Roseiflexaceae bacterium]|nr:hypothetical protein [Roseiflexaceae bacterium]